MYLPNHFKEHSPNQIRKLISENSFMTVISFSDNDILTINHFPIIYDNRDKTNHTLIGHMSKGNHQWQDFQKNSKCTIIVQGPNTYISPTWYKSGNDVPTWNYSVVHLYGKIELINSYEGQVNILQQQSEFFENLYKSNWVFSLPEDLSNEKLLTETIISFKFHIERVEAKFKLSQNRSAEDRQGVIAGLSERTDDMSKSILQMMKEI